MFSIFFGEQSFTSPNTNGSGAGIVYEHDQPVTHIPINKIEYPQGGLIPVLKGRQTSKKYHLAKICVDHFYELTYGNFSEITTSNEAVESKRVFENMQQNLM